jgi:hypothetical protein
MLKVGGLNDQNPSICLSAGWLTRKDGITLLKSADGMKFQVAKTQSQGKPDGTPGVAAIKSSTSNKAPNCCFTTLYPPKSG